jgi:chromosome segregation protein
LRLKAIELENFKTFAGRTRIPIIGNFAGITGPNGSGKSNVLDAILFILGPKSSKSMRVENLKELIFDGGKNGKPASHCGVSIIFDDDGRDVILKRVVRVKNSNYYSYYYLNDRASSFSDFENFFASSGMEGHYNIVQQGDINKIVTSSAFEKRRIIENVAGTSRFDDDIEQSERKKADVEENIRVLEGRLEEVKSQLKSLEQDRNKAIRYMELKEKLQKTKTELLVRQIQEYNLRIGENEERARGYDEEIKKLHEDIRVKESELEESNARMAEIAAEIEEKLGGEGRKIQDQINDCNVRIKTDDELLNFYGAQLKRNAERKKAIERELKDLDRGIAEARKSADEIKRSIEAKEKALNEKREALKKINEDRRKENARLEELNEKLDGARKEREKLLEQQHEKKLLLEELDARLSNAMREAEALENDLKRFETEEEEIRKTNRDREKRARELSSLVLQNKKRIDDLEIRKGGIKERIRAIKEELAKLDREYSKASAHANKAVSAVLKARNLGRLKGIVGTIGEKVRSRDERYATAIAVAAGSRMDAIITRTDEDAAKAIELLKKESSGRAQFLPLNKLIAPKPMGKALLVARDPASLGFASSLVDYDPEIRSAVEYVFGTTVVVDTLTSARRLMGGVRLVTPEGELIESSGAMIGGSKVSLESAAPPEAIERQIDERTRELEALNAELVSIEEEIGALEVGVKKALEEQKLMAQLTTPVQESRSRDYRERFQEAQEKVRELKEQKERSNNEIKETVVKLEAITRNTEALDAEIKDLTPKKVREIIDGLEKEVESVKSFIDVLREKEREADRELEGRMLSMEQMRKEIDGIEQEDSKARQEMERAGKEKEEAENELKALLVVKGGYDEKVGDLNREKEEITSAVSELRVALSRLRDRVDTTEELKIRCRSEAASLTEMMRDSERELSNVGPVIPEITTERTMDELRTEIKRIEERLLAMEPVNQRALEQYDEVAKRANEIESSVKRLDEQRRSLVALMDECRAKKREAFMSVFVSVNENFKAIYARISDGGYGELMLENPADPFAGGMRIVAQPSGKKAQSIERLSGGEKSVAALALVFAIQRISPSAFYFLDEVDMFLDSVNAEIIGKMIKESSNNTQTLVISLRKATLKDADVVYGITSVDGVSQMIGKININEISEVAN